jgi:phosphatidylserine synthase
MKNNIIGLSLIVVACVLIYAFFEFTPFIKNLNVHDFFKGFAIGVGLVAASAVVVLSIKLANNSVKSA